MALGRQSVKSAESTTKKPKSSRVNEPGKSLSQEIWEARISGKLTDEEYSEALKGLVGNRVRAIERASAKPSGS